MDGRILQVDSQQSVIGAGRSSRAFTPYGAAATDTGARLGYTGHLLDLVTGAYHLGNGYRIYQPQLMRFHSPDRLSPFGRGGINAYAYCNADPINFRDPNGTAKWLNGTWMSGLNGLFEDSSTTPAPQPLPNAASDWVEGSPGMAVALLTAKTYFKHAKDMIGTTFLNKELSKHVAVQDRKYLPAPPTAMDYGKLASIGVVNVAAAGVSAYNTFTGGNVVTRDASAWLTPAALGGTINYLSQSKDWNVSLTASKELLQEIKTVGVSSAQISSGAAQVNLAAIKGMENGAVGQRMEAIRMAAIQDRNAV